MEIQGTWEIDNLLNKAKLADASDLLISVGRHPMIRVGGNLQPIEGSSVLMGNDTERILNPLLNETRMERFKQSGDVDFPHSVPGGRFRVNVFKQRGTMACAIRLLQNEIPTLTALNMPPILEKMAMLSRGLVLVTGPTGSGKSTTLAAMIDYINKNKKAHIITIEDPIEYLHRHQSCMIDQREVGEDTTSFARALRGALRQDPDIILVGEMRDQETVSAAITAAETGHLVFSTLHTIGAANTIDRIIDTYPPSQQQQIKVQLSSTLKCVITQTLLKRASGSGRIAAQEIMVATDAISSMIREGKTHQLKSAMQTGKEMGMKLLDADLANLVLQGKITRAEAMTKVVDEQDFERYCKPGTLF